MEDHDLNAWLIVRVGGENLAVLLRNGRVPGNHRGRNAACRLDGERQWRHVEQEHVFDITLQNTALNRGTNGHDFIGVHALVRIFPRKLAGGLNDLRHAGHATHQNEFVDLVRVQLGCRQAVLHRLHRAIKKAVAKLLHLRTAERLHDVLRPGGIGRHERQVDVVALTGAEGDLRLLRFFLDPLKRIRLTAEVDAGVCLELINDPLDQGVVPVVPPR